MNHLKKRNKSSEARLQREVKRAGVEEKAVGMVR